MRRTYGKDPLYGLLLTFGAALVIEEGIRVIWGTRDYVLPVPQALSGGFIFQDLIWSTYRFYAAGVAAAAIGLVWLLIEKTPRGHDQSRCARQEMVRALGITFRGCGSGSRARHLAAFARHHTGAHLGIRPHMGGCRRAGFLIIVLGGIGSFWGAVVAGIAVGLAVGLSGAYASEWSLLSMYVLLVAVVTVRARGLFGKKSLLEA